MIRFFIDNVEGARAYRFPYRFKKQCREWLCGVAHDENKTIKSLNIILTTDKELLSINRQYLQHNDLTDIITFDCSASDRLEGELYISLDRITENAITYSQTPEQELRRIIVHGLLHLCGYSDKTEKEKIQMTEKENYYLTEKLK